MFRVAIDPGHGGGDEGTVYDGQRRRLTEKNLTLQIARQLQRQLRMRGYLVTLTRNRDVEVSLPDRTALANRWGADVFISIHMNSIQAQSNSQAEGVETFILNNTTDASSRRLARLENSVVRNSTVSTESVDASENLDVALILKDLRLDANLSESKRLACSIQNHLVASTSTFRDRPKRDRGVKQALFHVLLGADMPSILVETGFMSNASDRATLSSYKGQTRIARAIADAIDLYHQHGINSSKKALSTTSTLLGRCKVN